MLNVLMPSLKELVTSQYKDIKTLQTENIINTILKGYKPVPQPELIQVSGGPGSGKSTYCNQQSCPNFLYLSFDKIMLMLDGYQNTLKEYGSQKAFQTYEMPARIIGYEILSRAINNNINIMFEHSGVNNAHIELFKNITKIGYKISVIFIMCDIKLAIKRVQQRQKETNRHVPEQLIIERAQKITEYISKYKS